MRTHSDQRREDGSAVLGIPDPSLALRARITASYNARRVPHSLRSKGWGKEVDGKHARSKTGIGVKLVSFVKESEQ